MQSCLSSMSLLNLILGLFRLITLLERNLFYIKKGTNIITCFLVFMFFVNLNMIVAVY